MFDVTTLIQSGGLVLLGAFLFAEVGLFLGFFLPGDTLLLAAGIFAHQGKLPLAGVIIVAALAAIAGDSTAYFIGHKLGRKVFQKEGSALFDPKHLKRAESFYERYGMKAVFIAHYLPVVRTFTPLLAGAAKMPYRRFLTFNALGDISWAVILSLIGYYIGSRIPNVDHYILFVVGLVVIASAAPTLFHLIRHRIRSRRKPKDV